jgi:hypothetical protein
MVKDNHPSEIIVTVTDSTGRKHTCLIPLYIERGKTMKYLSILALVLSSLALIVAIVNRPRLMSPMSKEEFEAITNVLFDAFRDSGLTRR